MAHFKKGKPRRQVRCSMCTQFRWLGNSAKDWEGRRKARQAKALRNTVRQEDMD